MLYLLESDTRNVKWNGIPLHEATSAIIKEQMNGDFILTVRYPITDSEIYQLFREDMLIKAPAPVIGPQLFRIKKPVENDDHLEITAYHITDDVMQRSINPLSVNKQSCWQALSQLVQVAKSPINDFSFTSDITDRRTINTKEVETLYSVLMDGAHSIVGTWEGEMVRDNFAISIKRNRGEDRGVIISTHKNLKSYQRTKNSQNVVTRIHAKSTFKAEGAKEDTTIAITVDSPLIGAYPYINERSYTNNNIQTVDELTKWASAKFTNEHIDKATDAIKIEAYELDGQTVHMGDTVNLKSYKHNVDVYKKAIAYEYDCLANNGQGAYLTITFDDKVKSGGNGGGVSAVANAILDKQETQFDIMLERAIANADRAFDAEFAKREKDITDAIELAKAKAEEVKQELSDTINQRFDSFDNGPLKEAKRKAEEALKNAGASSLLAQEAKRIWLDSVAKLEAFKSQTTSAQTALSGNLDALKRTIANDIRPKQEQVTAEIAKQVEALVQTKKELAGVKSAQATYEETTTRRFAELTNLANGKASKSELTQTAEELASKIASVQASGRNLFLNSLFKQDISKTRIWTTSTYEVTIDSESKYLGHNALKIVGQDPMGRDGNNPKITYPALGQFGKVIAGSTTNQDITITFYAKANKNGIMLRSRLGNIWYKTGNVTLSTEIKRYVVHIPKSWTNESKLTTNEWLFTFNQEGTVWIWMPKFEISDVDTSYSEAPEDTDGQISAVESNFKQRADALDAGVRSLTKGLRTKADISSLNVTAENIRQSVKSLETDTQNKLNQKLSLAEFEVRAGSIRQEILNATKDKADKTLVVAEAGKLREEFSNLRVGGTNLLRGSKGPFLPDRKPANFDNNVLYAGQTSIYMEQGQEYIISAKTDGNFTAHHDGNKESDNVVLWIMDKNVRNYQIVSDLKTGTTGTKFVWDKPTGIYHLRVNTYHKETTKSVWDVKIEKGTLATDWSPAVEDTDGLITEAKATFERTAQGLRTDLSAIQEYVNKDGQRQEALQRYTREESAKQATAVREQISKDYVGKNTFQESVQGVERRLESLSLGTSGNLLKNSNDGFYNQHDKRYRLAETLQANQTYTLVSKYWHGENSTDHTFYNGVGKWQRLSYNKAIDAWVVQFTPTQEIPAGTEIVLSAVPNEAKGNMSWATLVRGAIPLIHWQPAKGDVEEGVTQKLAEYKETVDGRFATISSQINGKANQSDFQRVKETSQLYERILGGSGSSDQTVKDNVARLVMTNQLFQTEVGRYSGNGVNRAINTTSDWGPFITRSGNDGVNLHADLHKILSNGFKAGDTAHVRMEISIDSVQRFNDKQIVAILQSYGDVTKWARAGRTFDYNIGNLQPGNNWRLIEFDTVMTGEMLKNNSWMLNLRVDGASSYKVHTKAVKVEKGNVASAWSPAPEDTEEAIRTVQTQLDGSWAVQNINSAGDIISGINLGATGHNRITGKLTHITGETLIDNAVIKSAMVDKLKTANFEAGSVTTKILDAEAVTADKVRFDDAFIRKMIANEAFIDKLTSKQIFATKVESVVSSSTFLEAYQGRIGGFTIGHFDQGRGRWISGINQFSVGMGNGEGGSYNGENTAFWANWGYSWNYPGPNAWYVTTSGNMYCRNGADFHGKVDFSNSSSAQFYGSTYFRYSPRFTSGIHMYDQDILGNGGSPRNSGQNAVVWWNQVGEGTVKYWMDQRSDKRLKENITDTAVKALDKISRLRMVAFDFIESKKHEEIGLIAQEAETIVPKIVSRDPENPDGYLHIDYTALVPYLIKAIQELNQKIEKMEKIIA